MESKRKKNSSAHGYRDQWLPDLRAGSGDVNKMGNRVKRYIFPLIIRVSHGDVMESMVTTVDNIILHISK